MCTLHTICIPLTYHMLIKVCTHACFFKKIFFLMFLYSTQHWIFKHWQRPDSLLRHCCFKHKRQEIQQQQLLQAEIIRSGLCYAVHRRDFAALCRGLLRQQYRICYQVNILLNMQVLRARFKATIYLQSSLVLHYPSRVIQSTKGRFLRL